MFLPAMLWRGSGPPPARLVQVRVFGPRQDPTRLASHPLSISSPEMALYATVR